MYRQIQSRRLRQHVRARCPACIVHRIGAVPQVRGEVATVLATSVLSVLVTLFAVRWIGTPLLVKYPCAGAVAVGAATFPRPGERHEIVDAPVANGDLTARAQWLAQARKIWPQPAKSLAAESDSDAGCGCHRSTFTCRLRMRKHSLRTRLRRRRQACMSQRSTSQFTVRVSLVDLPFSLGNCRWLADALSRWLSTNAWHQQHLA